MNLLRIRISLADSPVYCEWARVTDAGEPIVGKGPLATLPRTRGRIQLIIPAAQVLFARTRLPPGARRNAGSALAFALEDETVGEPDTNQVHWVGPDANTDILAAIDRQALQKWLDALESIGIHDPEIQSETLLLPWVPDRWQLAWDGREGYVRNGEFDGAATDCGNRSEPPLSLRLMLEEAQARASTPTSIVIHPETPDATPDLEAWQHEIAVPLRIASEPEWRAVDWRYAPPTAGVNLAQRRRRWRVPARVLVRLRPAAWIVLFALVVQAASAALDWTLLSREQHALRQAMEAKFRSTFPDALAVVDPALQMRRKLAEARHAAGRPDRGDFLPMIEAIAVAASASDFRPGNVRSVSYEGGRTSFELSSVGEPQVRRLMVRIREAGFTVDPIPATAFTGGKAEKVVLTVRAL